VCNEVQNPIGAVAAVAEDGAAGAAGVADYGAAGAAGVADYGAPGAAVETAVLGQRASEVGRDALAAAPFIGLGGCGAVVISVTYDGRAIRSSRPG
jgi:hypothetical protein